MISLVPAPVIVRARLGAQRVQHPPENLGALRRQVPAHHPGPAERGRQPHAAVGEIPAVIEVAESVAQAAPIATRLTKAGLAQGSRGGFEAALQWEALA